PGRSRRLSARRARQLEQDGRRDRAQTALRPRRFDLPSWGLRRAAGAFAWRSFLATLNVLFIRARFGGKEKHTIGGLHAPRATSVTCPCVGRSCHVCPVDGACVG